MSYFRELPDILYQSNLLTKMSSQDYVAVKNLFRRVKILDSVKDVATLYSKYVILEGERPDTIAEKVYGSADLDWIVVLTAEITNIKDQWPLNNFDLYRYAENKYGTELNAIHHYETLEVRDSKGRLILPAGQVVDETFTIPAPYDATLTSNSYTTIGAYDNTNYSGTSDISPVVGISNYQYETRVNEDKREIFLMKPIYLQQYLNEMREIMNYGESSQYINNKLISTANTRLLGP